MVILGPLVAPSTSTVTVALPSASAPVVTFSPSTSITTGRVTESPTSWVTLSISMTSPTATFCCWPPLRTIAYTADSLSSSDYEFSVVRPGTLTTLDCSEGGGCAVDARRCRRHRGCKSTDGTPPGQN